MISPAAYFKFDNLSYFVGLFVMFFSLLITQYSLGYMRQAKNLPLYYLYIFLTVLASLGAVFANNLVLFMVFWGFLGLLLYLLISFGDKEHTSSTAKKAFIIIGGTDAFMLLGLAFIWYLTGTMKMDEMSIALNSKTAIIAYLCLAAGALAKAGAMPFHTWVPDTAEDAPAPVTAFLPASLDKLLGIYFLARISLYMFQMEPFMNNILMAIGSITIIAAVMMALVQHDFRRLLGYHAVSQVGYMVLGIGTGTLIGIAGGLFHMLNHAIYKSCLFLSGGSVEKKTGTGDLDKLGGLAKLMPVTFVTFLIASLAISGVPPFNGFASKWMIYQGIIESGRNGGYFWIVWLTAAMFGSALTLASFLKLIHAIFLGQQSKEQQEAKAAKGEISPHMWIPTLLLAGLCILFGVFAYGLPLKMFILPSLEKELFFSGIWNSSLATLLIIAGLIVGYVIYLLGSITSTRTTDSFIGGEELASHPEMRLSGTEFYNTIEKTWFLERIYCAAKRKYFDLYEIGSKLTFGFNKVLRHLHNGILPTYLAWCLLGMMILFIILSR